MDALVRSLVDGQPGAARRLERELMTRWSAGDHTSFDELIDELAAAAGPSATATESLVRVSVQLRLAWPGMRTVLLKQADLVEADQHAMLAVVNGIARFEGRAKYRTWLYTVARNEAIGLIRRRKHERLEVEFDESDGSSAFVARMSSVIITGTEVRAAIEALDEPFRTPLVLRDLDGLPYDEIALRLERNLETVKSQIHRGRLKVQQRMVEALHARVARDPG